MVEQQTREGEVVSSNPVDRVSREFSAKKCTDFDEDGRALAGGGLARKKNLKNFTIIFGFFAFSFCRV